MNEGTFTGNRESDQHLVTKQLATLSLIDEENKTQSTRQTLKDEEGHPRQDINTKCFDGTLKTIKQSSNWFGYDFIKASSIKTSFSDWVRPPTTPTHQMHAQKPVSSLKRKLFQDSNTEVDNNAFESIDLEFFAPHWNCEFSFKRDTEVAETLNKRLNLSMYEQRQNLMFFHDVSQNSKNLEKIHYHIEDWIKKHLNLENYFHLYELHDHIWHECIASVGSISLDSEFKYSWLKSCYSRLFRSIASKLVFFLKKFVQNVSKRFEKAPCFIKGVREQVLLSEYTKLRKKIHDDDFIRRMIQHSYWRLRDVLEKDADLIAGMETDLEKAAQKRLLVFYDEEMTKFLKNGPQSSSLLHGMHRKLIQSLIQTYFDAVRFGSGYSNSSVGRTKELIVKLEQKFKVHLSISEINLQELQFKVKNITKSCKRRYTRKMEDLISGNPTGLHESVLKVNHLLLKLKTDKFMESEIKSKVRPNEPLSGYKEELHYHMKKYFQYVLQINRSNLKAKKEHQTFPVVHIKDSRTKSRTSAITNKANQSHENKVRNIAKQDILENISRFPNPGYDTHVLPLALEFRDCSRFVMAGRINGEKILFRNELNEYETPAIVGLLDQKFIYGSKVTQKASQFWKLADFLKTSEYCPIEGLTFNGAYHKISFEFLLGFLLRNLKRSAEKKFGQQISTAVITIPFRLTSTQRLQITDGAKIAGFSRTRLVNESTAAGFLNATNLNVDSLLVISESTTGIEVFLYNFQQSPVKIIMLSRHSIVFSNENSTNSLKYLFCKNRTKRSHDENIQFAKPSVKDIILYVLQQSFTKNVGVVSSHVWKDILCQIEAELGIKFIFPTSSEASAFCGTESVIFGALELGEKKETLDNVVVDLLSYDLFRKEDMGRLFTVARGTQLPFNFSFKVLTGDTDFYQKNDTEKGLTTVGRLSITNTSQKEVKVCMQINCEGILIFKPRKERYNCITAGSSSNEQCTQIYLTWNCPNLTTKELLESRSWLDEILPTLSSNEIAILEAKTKLRETCAEMTTHIDAGLFCSSSNLIQNVVTNQIAEAKRFSEHPKALLEDINGQLNMLKKLRGKYFNCGT